MPEVFWAWDDDKPYISIDFIEQEAFRFLLSALRALTTHEDEEGFAELLAYAPNIEALKQIGPHIKTLQRLHAASLRIDNFA